MELFLFWSGSIGIRNVRFVVQMDDDSYRTLMLINDQTYWRKLIDRPTDQCDMPNLRDSACFQNVGCH